MVPRPRTVLIALWLVVVGAILVWTLVAHSGETSSTMQWEILLRHGLLMLALSTPSGVILCLMLEIMMGLFGVSIDGISEAVLVSIACGIAGYLQWFVLLPWLWRKWKVRRARNAASSA